MKPYSIFLTSLMMLLPLASCAEGSASGLHSHRNQILESGDILTISANNTASYFSAHPATRLVLAERIVNILRKTNARKSTIEFASSRLIKHPRLEREHFKVNLTDQDGTTYKFSYISEPDSNLYILNYLGTSKS